MVGVPEELSFNLIEINLNNCILLVPTVLGSASRYGESVSYRVQINP